MSILIGWLANAIAIVVAAYLLPGIHVADFVTALAVALVLGILNAIVKPILFFLTLPITIVTLGLFSLVLNALLVIITAHVVHGFVVDGFLQAFFFSIVLSLINTLLGKLYR